MKAERTKWQWIFLALTMLLLATFAAGCDEGASPTHALSTTATSPSHESIPGLHRSAVTAVPTAYQRDLSRGRPTAPLPTTTPQTRGKVNTEQGAHLRKGPGIDYAILRTLPYGEEVALLGRNRDGSWLRVKSRDGGKGWIYATLISAAGEDKDRLPVVPTPAREPVVTLTVQPHRAKPATPSRCEAGADISWPRNGTSLAGIVDFKGTASDPQFGYYKFEFRKAGDENWRFLVRFDRPVVNGVLMQWHLDTVPSGKYEVRLIVVKKDGNFLKPCEVTVNVSGGWMENPNRGGNCLPSYPTVCIPPGQGDLNCSDIPYRNFTVLPPDPYGFDGDGDGIGCETR